MGTVALLAIGYFTGVARVYSSYMVHPGERCVHQGLRVNTGDMPRICLMYLLNKVICDLREGMQVLQGPLEVRFKTQG